MFSFRDHLVQVIPEAGPNAFQPYRLLSGNSFELDPGASVEHVPGFSELPYDIVRKSNKPVIKMAGQDPEEVIALRLWIGGIGGYPYQICCIASRPGFRTHTLRAFNCSVSGGMGWKAEEASGSLTTFDSAAIDIHMDGISIYKIRHPK